MIDIINKLTTYKHRPDVKGIPDGSALLKYNLVGSNLNAQLKGKKDIALLRCNLRYASFPSWLIVLECIGQKNHNPQAAKIKKDFKHRARIERGVFHATRDKKPLGDLAGMNYKNHGNIEAPEGVIIDNLNLSVVDLVNYPVPPNTIFYLVNFDRAKKNTVIFPGRTDIKFLECRMINCVYGGPRKNIIDCKYDVHRDLDFKIVEPEPE